MSLESLFEKEYQELKNKVKELEKDNKLLAIDNANLKSVLMDIAGFIKKEIKPEFTPNNNLFFGSVVVSDPMEQERVLRILAQLGIKEIIKTEEQA